MIPAASESARHDAPDPPRGGFGSRIWVAARALVTLPRAALAAVIAVVVLVAIAVGMTLVEHKQYSRRVLPGVKVDGVTASGERELALYDEIARLGVTLEQAPLRVRVNGQLLTADPSLLDVSVDAKATANAAIAAGRRGNPFSQVFGTVLRRIRPERVHLRVDYDDNRLEGILDGWSAETQRGVVEGDLHFNGTTVIPIEPHSGSGILRDEAHRRLTEMLAGPTRPVVTLPVGTIRPRVDHAEVAAAARRARQLLAGPVTLVTGTGSPAASTTGPSTTGPSTTGPSTTGPSTSTTAVTNNPAANSVSIPVTPKQLASALGTRVVGHHLAVTLDSTRLHVALSSALAPLERGAIDASFAVTEENTVRVIPSRTGREIDMPAVARLILAGHRRVAAPPREIAPHHDTKWATKLGIVRQVSSFTTNYPAGQTRVVNIHRGADLLNNTVVEPGQTFSLNQTIGPRTAARGFVTAPVFAEGEFFDDFGGGVSQLATTTYNAGFFGGYKDITHQPHTIYISRYPPGREATVNYGAIDLQFKDDTAHGVLIRTYYSDTSISVAFYGDNDGRTVREENRSISNPVPIADKTFQCPAAKEADPNNLCASLTLGETGEASTGDPGFDVAFDRVIDQPGKPERREHYTWHYTMLPNQIVVGTAPPTTTTTTTTRPTSTSGGPTATTPTSSSRHTPNSTTTVAPQTGAAG